MRSGFAALVGRPNVGKSTLVNAVVGHKVAITTKVPQTTRHAIRAVLHGPDSQVVFVDTPGIHKPRTTLGSRMNDLAREALADADCVVLVVDAAAGVGRGDRFLAELLADVDTPTIAVANKVDLLGRAAQLPVLADVDALGDWDEIVPVSAVSGENLDTLVDLVLERVPEGPAFFPPDQLSDQPVEQAVGEIVREKAMSRMREEVPHSIAVVVDEITEGEASDVTAVYATVYVERDSQKGIVVGTGGATLRQIGQEAREELQLVLGSRVWLDLRVKLAKEWQRDPKQLERLGY